MCAEDGQGASYDWVTASINNANNVAYTISPSTTFARKAYFKVAVGNVYSDIVTIYQAEGSAALPFTFDSGKSDIATTVGLIHSGLGSDYNSSPLLKFDDSDDNLLLQINERPGKLTYDIKGNSFSNGTFKVQTSKDGTTFTDLKAYTSLDNTKQSEVFNNLDENVRYIKWIYTEKVDGNVALGNIKLEKYEAPQPYNLTVSNLENAEVIVFDAADMNTMLLDGAGTIQLNNGTSVSISVSANEGYVLKSVMVNSVNVLNQLDKTGLYTFTMPKSDVAISATAEEYVAPAPGSWVLTSLADLKANDVFVIVGTVGGSQYALSNNNGTSAAPAATSIDVENGNLSAEPDDNLKWTIGGNANDGYTFYPNGDTEKWLYCNTTAESSSNNNMRVGTGTRKVFMMDDNGYLVTNDDYKARYLSIYDGTDWRGYINATNGAAAISFYKKVEEEQPLTKTITDAEWATYVAPKTVMFPVGLTAYIVTAADAQKGVTLTPVHIVGEGTPVVLNGTANTYTFVETGEQADDTSDNLLRVVTANTPNITEAYVLAKPTEDAEVKFYHYVNDSDPLDEGQVYLPVEAVVGNGVRELDIDVPSSISTMSIEQSAMNNTVYDLQGRTVVQPTKGLYIVNGKKVIIK